jgi:hypothetical protein
MHHADKPVLIAERRVAERYGVSWRTLIRWDERPELHFPPVIKIGTRRFRALRALEQWDLENARRAAAPKAARKPRRHKPAPTNTTLET